MFSTGVFKRPAVWLPADSSFRRKGHAPKKKTFLWNPMQFLLERNEMKQINKSKNYIIFNMN